MMPSIRLSLRCEGVYQCYNRRNKLDQNNVIWKWYNENNAEGIRKSIINGANPNFCGPVIVIQKSLLHRTAEYGKVELVKVLLENGADPNMKDIYQRTPLHFAAENGHTDVVRLLLEHKADVSATDMKEVNALILAANIDIVELLISNGIDIESTDKNGRTVLHNAASKGKCDIVKTLLTHGANHSAKDIDGNTPILNAINNGHNDVVKALIDAGVNITEKMIFYGGESTLLHRAVDAKNIEIVKTLLDHGHPVNAVDGGNWRAFDSACVSGQADIVKLMLSRGANVNHIHGEMRRVPIHHTSDYNVLELLLKHKDTDVNAQDRDGGTAIYYAAVSGNVENFLLLLKYGADLHSKNVFDFDALLVDVQASVKQVDNLMKEHQTLENEMKILQKKCNTHKQQLKDKYQMIKIKKKDKELICKRNEDFTVTSAKETVYKRCKLKNQKHVLVIFLAILLLSVMYNLLLLHWIKEKTQPLFADIQSIVSTSFTVTGGYSSRLDWIKYGLEIDIPENALPSNISAEITVYISLSGPFIFPDSDIWKMASPIYWIYTNNSRNFIKPIQLGLLHTARNFTNPFQLRMVSTDGNSGKYFFNKKIGGHLISNISYFGYIYLLDQPVGYCVQSKK